MPDRPIRVLELRSVRGTGGGPEKTILLGTARTDPSRYAITVCYIKDARDQVFHIDQRAEGLGIEYVEILERHSFDRRIWGQLRDLAVEKHIDIVHSHDYKTDLLAWLLARRVDTLVPLATAHGWTGHSARERIVYYPGDRWMLARFPHVIAVSTDIRSELIRAGARPENVTVVLNAIDPVAFRRERAREAAARTQFGLPADAVVLGAIGRLEPQKDFARLIDVFARLSRSMPTAHLVIAGDGSLLESLRSQVDRLRLHDRCHLLGHVGDVPLLHHALDLFVQSSIYEGTPNAVLEAMALESPIVATDAGGTAEIARHDVEALIVPCGDEDALFQAIQRAVQSPTDTQARARRARHRVETELSFDARLRRVEAVYDRLAAPARASRSAAAT